MSRNFVSIVMCVRGLEPNQTFPVAPLKPIPVCNEPFSQVIIDCVGPLHKTSSGNQYLLTIMCHFTRFPEAIPLQNIKAPRIAEAQLTVNLAKSEFGQACVTYLGHIVRKGGIKPT